MTCQRGPTFTSQARYESLKVILTSNDRARFNSERLSEMGGLCLEMMRFQEAKLYLTRAILIDGNNIRGKTRDGGPRHVRNA